MTAYIGNHWEQDRKKWFDQLVECGAVATFRDYIEGRITESEAEGIFKGIDEKMSQNEKNIP